MKRWKQTAIEIWVSILFIGGLAVGMSLVVYVAMTSITKPTFDQLAARTALIRVEYTTPTKTTNGARGSGFLLDSGRLLAARHVFLKGNTGAGHFPEDKEFTFMHDASGPPAVDATLVDIHTDAEFDTSVKVRCTYPQAGEPVHIIAYPGGAGPIISSGIVASFGPLKPQVTYGVSGSLASVGMSGGPVFDSERRLIGIVVHIYTFDSGSVIGIVSVVDIEGVCEAE